MAVRNEGECVSHQLAKTKGLVKVLGLDEQHKGKVTLLTVLDYL